MNVLIDSNILFYYFQNQQPYADLVEKWLDENKVAISVISIAEYLSKPPPEGKIPLERILPLVEIIPINLQIAKIAGDLRHRLVKRKVRIALIDCFIAATAIDLNYKLATADKRGFPFGEVKFAKF